MTDDECPGSLILYTRKYPNNSTRQDLVFEAALSGNAVSLSKVLQQMEASERTSLIECEINYFIGTCILKRTPLMVAAKNGLYESTFGIQCRHRRKP